MSDKTETNLPAAAPQNNSLALLQKDLVGAVETRVQQYVRDGGLLLPPGYSVENAMKSAWLILQMVEDKDHKLALHTCSRNSIANALLDMAVQGLNPAKKQGYFIAYGKNLVFQRSYFGAMALARRINPAIAEFFAEVVYEGDELEYVLERGRKTVTTHKQKLENIDKHKIVAVYAGAISAEGELLPYSVLLTWEEVLASWKMSKAYPLNDNGTLKEGSTHAKHTAEMCKRTAINRLCKPIINASSDSDLFRECATRADRIVQDHALDTEIAENANGEVLDVVAAEAEAEADGQAPDATDGEPAVTAAAGGNGKKAPF